MIFFFRKLTWPSIDLLRKKYEQIILSQQNHNLILKWWNMIARDIILIMNGEISFTIQ